MNPIRLISESPSCVSTGTLDFGGAATSGSPQSSAGVRPLSPPISSSSSLALALAMAEDEAPVFSPSLASSSPGKVSLPSLSPEKPSGQRSPERAFAKRPPPSPERPTSPKF